jgi:hypothetical protein
MQLGEMVNAVMDDTDDSCLFKHYTTAPGPNNYWTNSSTQLGTNLATEWAAGTKLYLPHMSVTTIATGPSGKKNYTATYNPHHVLPGEASWPKTKLKRWVDVSGDVLEDIGYNVNRYYNGIDLPSSNEMRGNWTADAGRSEDFQARYAFAAMDAESRTRQFHDSHEAYSDFATNVLDKIAAKLDNKEKNGNMGCGNAKCPGEQAKKKYPTPHKVLPRILQSAARLSRYLWGSPRKWRKPIMTSKYSLMYKNRKLTQTDAADQLKTTNFTY